MALPNKSFGARYVVHTVHGVYTNTTSFYGQTTPVSALDFSLGASNFVELVRQFSASWVTVVSVQGYNVNGNPTYLYTPPATVTGALNLGIDDKESYSNQLRLSGVGAIVPPDQQGRKVELVFTSGSMRCTKGVRKILLSSIGNSAGIHTALLGVAADMCDYRGGLVTLNGYVSQKQNTYLSKKRGF